MTARIDTARAASITVVCGGSGSGKSAWVKRQIDRAPRVLVWDVDDEYAAQGFERITSAGELVARLRNVGAGRARVAYVTDPTPAAFDLWARAALAWGNCVAVAEELADVTTPGKAPPGWGALVRRGRKYGVSLYAITQRPAESDKTVMGNATTIHAGRLQRAQDRAYVAAEIGAPVADMDALKPLEWIERDALGGITRGKLRF